MSKLTLLKFEEPPPKSDPDMVDFCEKLLVAAKSGAIIALVGVWQFREGGTDYKWVALPGAHPCMLIGQLQIASSKIVAKSEIQYDEPPPIPRGDPDNIPE